MVFNSSCLSVECRGPLKEKQPRCVLFGRRPQGWLSAYYIWCFEYDLVSVFTCYWRHHATKFAGARFATNRLSVNTWQFSMWGVKSFGEINSRSDLIRGSMGVDGRCLRPMRTVICFALWGWTVLFLLFVQGRHISDRTVINLIQADGYRSRRPVRYPRLILVHRRRRREWGKRHRVWDLRHWRHCICSDEVLPIP